MTVTSGDGDNREIPFSVTVTRPDGAEVVIAVAGEIDLTTSEDLKETFEAALEPAPGRLVVDLEGVDFCDSTGLAALVRINDRCGTQGVDLSFLPSPTIRRLASKTGLSTLLPLAGS
ncbi:anti-sigma factor antagonist [Amycolatopsis sp. WAC 01375]|uniref:STAS domain-containing protein n=1 Tax=unclassified Amycolatopsis TaxID=2618356 RepID=UPI000F7901B7|nr:MULTISPECIES: STAS domain-containing protein [unclassified Amycolatopsis]RSM79715.1 anti-sigma factor antagonist [Amycolatopsis sp. WAC 01375]RSN27445.1 anti-sigma factor antagonist [Amycolatopsis sp. WAC 01416]